MASSNGTGHEQDGPALELPGGEYEVGSRQLSENGMFACLILTTAKGR